MKCDLCSWNEMPNVIPRMMSHAEADHKNISQSIVVWRDQELVLTDAISEGDKTLSFFYPGYESSINEESELDVELQSYDTEAIEESSMT